MADDVPAPVLNGWQWLLYKAMQWILPSLTAALVAYLMSLPARDKAERANVRSEQADTRSERAERVAGEAQAKVRVWMGGKSE